MLVHKSATRPGQFHESLSALWVGERDDAEFADTYAVLARRTKLQTAANLMEAKQIVASTPDLSLAVVAQTSGGQCPADALDELERLAPLVRWVQIRGSWCSGLQRGPLALPAALRLPWHRAARWFTRELDTVAAGRAPQWSAPLTLREDEIRLVESRAPRVPPLGAGALAVVVTQQHAWGNALCDLLVAEGFACSRYLHGEPLRTAGAALLVWEAEETIVPSALAAARQALGGPATLVVAPWLTGASKQAWHAAGADDVLQQPFELVDFADALDALLAAAR